MKKLAGLALAGFVLSGCSTFSFLGLGEGSMIQSLDETEPKGTPFQKAQFQNYAALAKSLNATDLSHSAAFDEGGSAMIDPNTPEGIAIAFARKAMDAAKGQDVAPESGSTPVSDQTRIRLLSALTRGRTYAPDLAARAQADFDCWQLNNRAPGQERAAKQCKRSLDTSLPQLEGRAAWAR